MDTSARQGSDRSGARLVLAGVSLAFVCGFASLGAVPVAGLDLGAADDPDLPSAAASLVHVPALGAARPDLAAWRPPVRDRTGSVSSLARAASVHVRPSRPERLRAFAADVGELAWRAVHDGVDGRLWRSAETPAGSGHGRGLAGIGFPAIARSPVEGMRVYRPLVVWRDAPEAADGRVPIAGVRCMGLSSAAVARRAARYEALVVELSMKHGVSASLVKAVITEESCFDPQARSPVGAIGLMQLMPATAAWLKVGDPTDPAANLDGGIRYLAMLRKRYVGDTRLALAAYNAGPGNVRRYGGVPPFAETRRYVTRVAASHRRYVAATALATR